MGIRITETHDCHASKGVCRATCCPISASAPTDICPKTHKVAQ